MSDISMQSADPDIILDVVHALGGRPDETPTQRERRSRGVERAVRGFDPRGSVETMFAGLAVTHFALILDSARDVVLGQADTTRARTKSTVVGLDRMLTTFLKEVYRPAPRGGETPVMPGSGEAPAMPGIGEVPAMPGIGETPAMPWIGEAPGISARSGLDSRANRHGPMRADHLCQQSTAAGGTDSPGGNHGDDTGRVSLCDRSAVVPETGPKPAAEQTVLAGVEVETGPDAPRQASPAAPRAASLHSPQTSVIALMTAASPPACPRFTVNGQTASAIPPPDPMASIPAKERLSFRDTLEQALSGETPVKDAIHI